LSAGAAQRPKVRRTQLAARTRAIEVALKFLGEESPRLDVPAKTDERIKRALGRRGLGREYDQATIERLRAMKDGLYGEITGFNQSPYWLGSNGPYADQADFDVERLVSDTGAQYPDVPTKDLEGLVRWMIFWWYMK